MPRAASRPTAAPRLGALLSRADVVLSEAAQGHVNYCEWHGMQEVTALEATLGLLLATAAGSCLDWGSCRFFEAEC